MARRVGAHICCNIVAGYLGYLGYPGYYGYPVPQLSQGQNCDKN